MSTASCQRLIKHLKNVEGVYGRTNNLLVTTAGKLENVSNHVIFFPGDLQNTQEEMSGSFDGQKWMDWSYERVSDILSKRFMTSLVWIVHPRRMQDGIFSCFENLLHSDRVGSPENYADHDAIKHIGLLLREGGRMVSSEQDSAVSGQDLAMTLAALPLTLVGFSKGSIVLNQLVYEIDAHLRDACPTEGQEETAMFMKRVKSFYWLDGGHSGMEANVWVTERGTLSMLAGLGCEVRVHVTPWQIHDASRPHIGEQERIFVDTLRACGANVEERVHFPDERKFENHFRVLKEF